MREIKFRGMSLAGKWFYGDLAKPKNDISSNVKGGGSFISNKYGMPHAYAVRPETVCQYTGLKDKSDVEIYEGDIIEYGMPNDGSYLTDINLYPFEVKWIEEKAGFNINKEMLIFWQVIGNIYENPELLK